MSTSSNTSMTEQLNKCFLPIFSISASALPEHEGTGVLVETRSARWLVTAAHVMAAQAESVFYLPGSPSLFPITGEVYSTSELTPMATHDDQRDVAFIKLKDTEIGSLLCAGMGFHSTAPDAILAEPRDFTDNWCYVGGYPKDSIDVGSEDLTARGHPFMFLGSLYTNLEMKLRHLDAQRLIGVRYDQVLSTDRKPIKRPNPKGMSGGPIWVSDAGRLRLAGIMIEFYEKKSIIIGVRTLDLFQAMELHS